MITNFKIFEENNDLFHLLKINEYVVWVKIDHILVE